MPGKLRELVLTQYGFLRTREGSSTAIPHDQKNTRPNPGTPALIPACLSDNTDSGSDKCSRPVCQKWQTWPHVNMLIKHTYNYLAFRHLVAWQLHSLKVHKTICVAAGAHGSSVIWC